MTRELNFRHSFIEQFAAFGFNLLQFPELSRLAASDFPAYAIALGDTTYTAFDPAGIAVEGKQEFQLALCLTLAEHAWDDMLAARSDDLLAVESFLHTGFVPPPIGVGENYRIVRTALDEVLPPVLQKAATRFAIVIKGHYTFTLF